MGAARPGRSPALFRRDLPDRHVVPAGRAFGIAQDDGGSIDRVWAALDDRATALLPRTDTLTLKRDQRSRCQIALDALRTQSGDPLVMAELFRIARGSLAAVIGLDATDEMLDALFIRFCIGK